MINKDDIIREIDEAIDYISAPLRASDIEFGWTEGIRQNWLRGLISLREEITFHPLRDLGSINLARDLGMDGIDRGHAAERIARVGSLLRKSREEE